jgi:predicted permease
VPIARGASAGVDVALDGGVLAASVLLTLAAGVLCGLTPALDALKTDVIDSLRHGRAGRSGGASRSRRLLLAAQVATSMVLLAGGGLLLRSYDAARQTDLGFSADGVVTAAVDIGARGFRREPDNPFWTTLLDRIRALPGTEAAALAFRLPLELGITRQPLAPYPFTPVPGRDWPEAEFSAVSPGYFSTLRIPLLEGRDFDDGDAGGAASVVIVNDVIAARFWPGTSAVGRLMTNPDGSRIEVVGVVRRSKYLSIGEPPTAYAYFPVRQQSPRWMTVVARTRDDRRAYAEAVRSAIRGLDQQATVDVALLSDRVRLALLPAAGSAAAISVVTLLALVLTGLGLFGAVAQTVGRRTYEIGVRRALGAPDSRIASLVVGNTLVVAGSGLGAGLVAAVVASRPLRAVLYSVDVADPLVFAAAPAALLMTCVLAICLPTWRALRITAAEALRHE